MKEEQSIWETIDMAALCTLSRKAGNAIMDIYNDPTAEFGISFKEDHSPLTKADKASHEIIKQGLRELYPAIPLLSEEGAQIPYTERKDWNIYWCVDPLDGTKEFIKRNGEFTVNIALIINNSPCLGVIYLPVKKLLYYASKASGAWKQEDTFPPIALLQNGKIIPDNWTAVGSRSHGNPEEESVLEKYRVSNKISAGSSLKFCLVAENTAQIYCRTGPTMEWDTAAGQAIVENAGGKMETLDGKPFVYNKPSLLNPGFICKVN